MRNADALLRVHEHENAMGPYQGLSFNRYSGLSAQKRYTEIGDVLGCGCYPSWLQG
jgi:hypothetical protein